MSPDHGTRTQHGSVSMLGKIELYENAPSGRRRDPDGEWWTEALCKGWGSPRDDPWFSSDDPDAREIESGRMMVAVAHCVMCPVQRPCLTAALDDEHPARLRAEPGASLAFELFGTSSEVLGVWAGTIPRDRKGKTVADVDDLLTMARERAVRLGLAPPWLSEVLA